ncbi:DUF4139 domain-containing protein [Rhodobacterales bacterium]|nr:DUF4139 domain-containing protein [Rhodobacterales bacterium]
MFFRLSCSAIVFLVHPLAVLAADNGPITSITLSSGGLAEVVRKADIDSDGLIRMTIPLEQVNDVLKSIVVFDDAGAVEGITLPGPSPLAETFKNLPFAEEDLQSPALLLARLQGTNVRLDRAGSQTEGMVLGVSSRNRGDRGSVDVVSVLSNGKIVGVELEPDTEITFLDEDIREKVVKALSAVGSGKSDGSRSVSLKVTGEGEREVAVSYVVPAPIWKTAYRIVTMDDDTARLQAWAILENASGEDWDNVEVTLSSGAPVTLKQRLHDLYWKERLEVPVDVSAGYVPPMDEGAEPSSDTFRSERKLQRSGLADRNALPAPLAEAAPSFDAFEMAEAQVGEASEGAVTASFQIPWPVSLQSGETLSAPIVDKVVPAETVSVFQPGSGSQHPVAAILIRNETDTSLPQGILTVYDRTEGYVGDARIGGMPSGESRLASFATDKKVRINQTREPDYRITKIKVVNGVLTASVLEKSTVSYVIKGAPDGDRTVVIEHPRMHGWKFSSPQHFEDTPTHNRLKIDVAEGATETVSAVSEKTISETFALVRTSADQLLDLSNRAPDPETAEKLQDLAALQSEITQVTRRIEGLQRDKAEETTDQQRHRANLAAVEPGADLYKSSAFKLTQSETRIEEIDQQIAELEKREAEIRETLGEAIRTF